ncbi:MAG: cobalt-precorrin-6A reductase [Sneathiella sp.]|nr:cobalt-precorrin-6A reductase [Sneathiella sp.]
MKNILLIGGTGEAVQVNKELSGWTDVFLTTSLAGRTLKPTALMGDVLMQGFADYGGMGQFLKNRNIDLVIDASHPFATGMSQKAVEICKSQHVPLIRYDRKQWESEGNDWLEVNDLTEAASRLSLFDRIFLTVGRQELHSFLDLSDKFFLVRSIEDIDFDPDGSEVHHIRARGPFSVKDEIALMKENHVDVMVSKNSGGDATFAKISAAQSLSIPVVMVKRPPLQAAKVVHDLLSLYSQIKLSF